MKVALDEGVPENLIGHLPGHEVQSVRMLGLKGAKNGKLLSAIAAGAFEAFITNDKRMEAEGQLHRRPFGILILSVTNWHVMRPYVGKIAEGLDMCEPGSVGKVDCGRFLPRKLRAPGSPNG